MVEINYFSLIFRLIASLGLIIGLLMIILKYGGSRVKQYQSNKYIRVIDRTPLNKDASLEVVKIGEEAFVISVTKDRVEILKEVKNEELQKIEKIQKIQKPINYNNKDIKALINKLMVKGRIKNEEK